MVLLGDEDRQPLLMAYLEDLPVHLEAFGNTAEDVTYLFQPLIQLRQVKLYSHEEHSAVRVHRILVRLHDVRAMLIQKCDTAATIPGPSGQDMSIRARSG